MHIPENVDQSCGIYRIKNLRNGKCYIGSSKDLKGRERGHLKGLRNGRHHSIYLQRAWDLEQDKSVFEFQIFIYCKESELIDLEQSCFNAMKPEYNSSKTAGRTTHTDEFKSRMSLLMSGRSLSEETKKILSEIGKDRKGPLNGFHGKSHSKEVKDEIGRKAKTRLSEKNHPMLGKKHRSESIDIIKAKAKGKRDGEKNGNSKLTEEHVILIRHSEDKLVDLAKRFSVSISQIKRIRYGKAWTGIIKGQNDG